MLDPYPFQLEAIELGTSRNILLADACGMGKSLVAIEIARATQPEYPGPVLVVARKQAKTQWASFIQEQDQTAWINTVDTLEEFDDLGIGSHSANEWTIIHFAALRKVLTDRTSITKIMFSTIIVDEAHHIKGRKSQQSKGTRKLLAFRKVALTATPMEKAPHDLWAILNFLYPTRYTGYYGFEARYVEKEKHPYMGWEKIVGPKNTEQLAKELAPFFLQRTKEEVREDLPPLTESRVPLLLNQTLQTIYNDIKNAGDILVYLDDEEVLVKNALAEMMLLRRLISNGLNKWKTDKIEWVREYVRDNPQEQIVVMSVFRDTASKLARVLKAPLIMHGEPMPDLTAQPPLLVGTIKSMGESLDMPWFDTIVFVDSEWSTIAMKQARDRIHRINITSPKHAVYLYHPGTVDDLVFSALDNKWSTVELVHAYINEVQRSM